MRNIIIMSLEDLPNELLIMILEYVPDASHIRTVCKQFNNIVGDIERRVFNNSDKYIEKLSPPVYFLLKYYKYHELIFGRAIIKGNLNLIIELDRLGYKFDADVSMKNAAREGHKNLIDFFIGEGARNWNDGMAGAAGKGYKYLVDFFIEKGANHWNYGMAAAAKDGNENLVMFFIAKGANNWNWGMVSSSTGGHKNLVEFFIEKGAKDWDWAMANAAEGGHKDLIDFFIEKGADHWTWAMKSARQGGHKNLVDFFIEKSADIEIN